MADDAHFAALHVFKVGECKHYEVERVAIEIAESLVDEKLSNVEVLARE